MNPNDYIAPTMPDANKPCYLCKHGEQGGNNDFPFDFYCKLLEICINDWGTCQHYEESEQSQAINSPKPRENRN